MNARLLLIIFAVSVVPVAGQTATQLEQAHGKPTLAYSVTEHIWMTPDFAADGQPCRMRFYPKRMDRDATYLGGQLIFAELKSILNRIVPPFLRGNRKFLSVQSMLTEGIVQTEYEYDEVTFNFGYSTRITIDPDTLKQAEVVVDLDSPTDYVDPPKPPPPPPSDDDFEETTKVEIVILEWNNRSCVQENKAIPRKRDLAQIELQFGPAQKIYSVGSGISMSARFAADGQVCRMWLFPKRVSGDTSAVGNTLEFEEVRRFLNDLVPPKRRGLKQDTNFGATATGGHMAWTTYPYENVYFTFIAGARLTNSPFDSPLRNGEFTFPFPDYVPPVTESPFPSKLDFRRGEDAEIVTVQWLHRTCVP